MADLTIAIPMLRESSVAVLRIHTEQPEMTKNGNRRPADSYLSVVASASLRIDRSEGISCNERRTAANRQ